MGQPFQIVGMNLHRRRSVLVRMAEDGRKLGTARITNSRARLTAEIKRAGQHPQVVLEACYGWYWAADALAAARRRRPGSARSLTRPGRSPRIGSSRGTGQTTAPCRSTRPAGQSAMSATAGNTDKNL